MGAGGHRVSPWAAAALAVAAMLAWVWASLAWDPVGALRSRASRVVAVRRAPGPCARCERWSMVTTAGDTLSALWRSAPAGSPPAWDIVLLGGLVTGDRAALLVPEDAPVGVLAVDWPWRGPRRMSVGEFLARSFEIREALLRSPAAVAAGVEALEREAEPRRIAIVGASLGVPPALAALRLTRAPRALVLIDGAADLERCLRRELEPRLGPPLARLCAAVALRLIYPLEPGLHAEAARGLPTLLLNARRDERLPPESIARLHSSLPGADVRWRETPHLRPSQAETLASLSRQVSAWLAALDTSASLAHE